MLFLVGTALAVCVGLLAGGRMNRLADLHLSWFWIAPLAFVIQFLVVYGPAPFSDFLAIPLIVASHAALVLIALLNLRAPGLAIAAVGLAMNLSVIVANGGLMPVSPETVQMAGREAWKIGDGSPGTHVAQSKDIIRAREDTWLEPLADRYWTGLPGRLGVIFSLGDVVLLLGVCALVVRTMTVPTQSALHFSKRGIT
jgi:hypothetical protein